MQLSSQQKQQIHEAAQRLKSLHPDLMDKVSRNRKRITELAANHSIFRLPITLPAEKSGPVDIREILALLEGRPGILITNGDFDLTSYLPNLPDVLAQPLQENKELLRKKLAAIGRIEVSNHPRFAWLGTGFLVTEDVLVTNAHVADEIGYRNQGGKYQFIEGVAPSKPMSPTIDYREEHDSKAEEVFDILEVLHIEDKNGPDLAFLRVEPRNGSSKVEPIEFQSQPPEDKAVGAVGYPAKDSRGNPIAEVLEYLGQVFNKKRISPGIFLGMNGRTFEHDCSTLGGNSGSPIIDLKTGKAVGVHAGGTFPGVNHGVSAEFVMGALEKVTGGKYRRPTAIPLGEPKSETVEKTPSNPAYTPPQQQKEPRQATTAISAEVDSDETITWEVPLRVTVGIGKPRRAAASPAQLRVSAEGEPPSRSVEEAFRSLPGVVHIRQGFSTRNGRSTDERALIVTVEPHAKESVAAKAATFDSGMPVEVRTATPSDYLAKSGMDAVLERVPSINYQIPGDLSLDAVDEKMFAVFHVSPDSGWSQLKDFLGRTQERLTIGLYNFSTDHTEAALIDALGDNRELTLVLGQASIDSETIAEFESGLIDRLTNVLGTRFKYQRAEAPGRRLFAGHYHIKVAVRDRKAIWLSSGNWDKSNQPELDQIARNHSSWEPLEKYNREWHAVVVNDQLAAMFEDYINYDFESYKEIRETPIPFPEPMFLVPKQLPKLIAEGPQQLEYFEPYTVPNRRLKIQPLLSPDNYQKHVLELIKTAHTSIEIENQSFKWKDTADERFAELGEAILERKRNGVTVRIIIRGEYGGQEQKDDLKLKGFRDQEIRILDKVHTKGLIVDSKIVVLGSHNWTDHGVLGNRDASLIVYDVKVAEYFRDIFDFDWKRASEQIREMPPDVRLYHPGEPIPENYTLMSWRDVV